jgi:glutamate-ammonia-ligase adenylyltransferase
MLNSAVQTELQDVGFADYETAMRSAQRLQALPAAAGLLPALLAVLAHTPNPDRALLNFERFLECCAAANPPLAAPGRDARTLEKLARLFAGSQYLTEILLRDPVQAALLADHAGLARVPAVAALQAGAQQAAMAAAPEDALRRWQHGELLRIGAADLLGLLDLATVTAQLTAVADSVIAQCLRLAANGSAPPAGFAVVALGKLGGSELNYSSDVDLLFVAQADAQHQHAVGQALIGLLTRTTSAGFLYRVDMRLRPLGRAGALVCSLAAHAAYLQQHARQWELQALLKARLAAGDEAVFAQFQQQAAAAIFNIEAPALRSAMHAMKQRTEAQLQRAGRAWGEVKLGMGSIRDVEFVVQFLQRLHGAALAVRSPNTLLALQQLAQHGLVTPAAQHTLADGYRFLRTIEHHLQLLDYRQTHTLPADEAALTALAQRLGFTGGQARADFVERYEQHSAAIRAVYWGYFDAPAEAGAVPQVQRHVLRMAPSYTQIFSAAEVARHAALAATLDGETLAAVEGEALPGGQWRVTIVANDYLGELTIICGLLFVHGWNIVDGHVFTYEPAAGGAAGDQQRKIVDVFTVQPVARARALPVAPQLAEYARELHALLALLQAGERRAARGQLARRVAAAVEPAAASAPLPPLEIEIDNTADPRYTVLRLGAPDTVGFLYEFTNALAMQRVHIARVEVQTSGARVQDTLYVTDAAGARITAPDRQQELRAACTLVKHFTHLLPHSPDPAAALLHFHQFLGQLFARPNWPRELASLDRPPVLDALVRLLGVSDFLWEDFLRLQYDNLLPLVADEQALAAARPRAELAAELAASLQAQPDGAAQRTALNAFKDREMFRIDMRYIQGRITEFGQFSDELGDVAEVVVAAALGVCAAALAAVHGAPLLADGSACALAVCALGKCGGRELGFASDIELMFVYSGPGQTRGPRVLSNADYYERLVENFVALIAARRNGVFEVDLQLRPYGAAGRMAVSLESFATYFAPAGGAWDYERQALVKLRPVAGDAALGAQLLALRDEFVYTGARFDAGAMRAMRERQLRHLVTAGTLNAKFSTGMLVDVEYLVQALQITHGAHAPALRVPNTRTALAALRSAGVLDAPAHSALLDAYNFARRLINALRMVRGNARDLTVPPADGEEFAFLARRLGFGSRQPELAAQLAQHVQAVQQVSARLMP